MPDVNSHHARWRLVFWLLLTVTTVLALWPLQKPLIPQISDKIQHSLAFFALASLAVRSWPKPGLWPKIAIYLLLYGIGIEVVQQFIPYRTFSLADWAADGLGILLCLATEKWAPLCCRA